MLSIDNSKCIGCGLCEQKCSFNALRMEGEKPIVSDACVYCGICENVCPVDAITITKLEIDNKNLDKYKGVWVILESEIQSNKLKKVSFELLSEARKLADELEQEVSAILLCTNIPENLEQKLSEIGCNQIYLIESSIFNQYDTEIYTDTIINLVRKYKPATVLFPATENGRDLAPRISCALKVGLTADCTALDIDDNMNLVQIRPTYGGSIMASIISENHRPQLASVRPNVFMVSKLDKCKSVKVIREVLQVETPIKKVSLLKIVEKKISYKSVTEAEVIIAGGYGMGSAENFKVLQEIAAKLNAAVGATRKAVDEGWATLDMQVGQTGKIVTPEIYIACGISGALQHTLGFKNAKRIIAINNNPTAPIFSIADVAIIGDAVKIITELIRLVDKYGKEALMGDRVLSVK